MLSISVSANTNGPTLLRQDQLDNTAGTFLDKKVRLMVDSNVLDVQKSNARKLKSASLDKEASLIVDFRREMSSLGETYINPKSELEVISQRVGEDGNLYVVANETTTLTIAENGVETGYSANHEFVYSKDDNQWVLIEDRQLEPTGLLPLYQAEEFVYHGQGDIKSNKELETNPSSESSENLTEKINLIPEIEASIDRKNNINKDTKSDNAKSTSLRAPGGYNYSAMAAYLEKYWNNYNKSYRDFSKNGGDCTNFVSQALKAGGWQHKSGYYKNSSSNVGSGVFIVSNSITYGQVDYGHTGQKKTVTLPNKACTKTFNTTSWSAVAVSASIVGATQDVTLRRGNSKWYLGLTNNIIDTMPMY